MNIVVLCPHFAPDTAPTGTVMTGIVHGLAERGHEIHVVTSLPWYREHAVDSAWTGRLMRTERVEWGSITRVHPFPGNDKRNLLRRAVGFVGFTLLAAVGALRAGGPLRRVDAVLAMSPPLTLGPTGWFVAKARRGRFVFNIQDVFPDAAVRTGALSNARVIALAERLERLSYRMADVVTVLSDDLAENVLSKLPRSAKKQGTEVVVIPNFVDMTLFEAAATGESYRAEFGLGSGPVVMYAGNLGFSQSLDLVVKLAEARPHLTVVINGDGTARAVLQTDADRLPNLHLIGYQPVERLPEVLAAADIHLVPLKAGLGSVSVPSKTYSILAARRPVIASIDRGTAIEQLLNESGAGIVVDPDRPDMLIEAIDALIADEPRRASMGNAGHSWVREHASPETAASMYERVLSDRAAG